VAGCCEDDNEPLGSIKSGKCPGEPLSASEQGLCSMESETQIHR
jgi:hypothetical protein